MKLFNYVEWIWHWKVSIHFLIEVKLVHKYIFWSLKGIKLKGIQLNQSKLPTEAFSSIGITLATKKMIYRYKTSTLFSFNFDRCLFFKFRMEISELKAWLKRSYIVLFLYNFKPINISIFFLQFSLTHPPKNLSLISFLFSSSTN